MAIEVEIDRFRKYLCEVAVLSKSTVVDQCNTVKAFLYSSFPEKNFSSEEITADHIRIYFVSISRVPLRVLLEGRPSVPRGQCHELNM